MTRAAIPESLTPSASNMASKPPVEMECIASVDRYTVGLAFAFFITMTLIASSCRASTSTTTASPAATGTAAASRC